MPKTNDKARYFDFILYPDSSPDNRVELLEKIGVPIVMSPIHDKDVSDVEGQEFKKPHYHVIYVAANPVTVKSVRNKVNRALGTNAVTRIEIVLNIANMFAYLTHDSDDAVKKGKHHYAKDDLVFLNNFDIDRYITLSVEEKDEAYDRILDIIAEYGLANINELRRFVRQQGTQFGIDLKIMNKVIREHTGLVRLYFDASYQERQNGIRLVNYETGEIESEI